MFFLRRNPHQFTAAERQVSKTIIVLSILRKNFIRELSHVPFRI